MPLVQHLQRVVDAFWTSPFMGDVQKHFHMRVNGPPLAQFCAISFLLVLGVAHAAGVGGDGENGTIADTKNASTLPAQPTRVLGQEIRKTLPLHRLNCPQGRLGECEPLADAPQSTELKSVERFLQKNQQNKTDPSVVVDLVNGSCKSCKNELEKKDRTIEECTTLLNDQKHECNRDLSKAASDCQSSTTLQVNQVHTEWTQCANRMNEWKKLYEDLNAEKYPQEIARLEVKLGDVNTLAADRLFWLQMACLPWVLLFLIPFVYCVYLSRDWIKKFILNEPLKAVAPVPGVVCDVVEYRPVRNAQAAPQTPEATDLFYDTLLKDLMLVGLLCIKVVRQEEVNEDHAECWSWKLKLLANCLKEHLRKDRSQPLPNLVQLSDHLHNVSVDTGAHESFLNILHIWSDNMNSLTAEQAQTLWTLAQARVRITMPMILHEGSHGESDEDNYVDAEEEVEELKAGALMRE